MANPAIRMKIMGREDFSSWVENPEDSTLAHWTAPFQGYGTSLSMLYALSDAQERGYEIGDWPEGWIEFANGATIYFDYRGIGELFVPWVIIERDSLNDIATGRINNPGEIQDVIAQLCAEVGRVYGD